MYNTLYELIMSWLFDGAVITGEIEMVATFLTTLSTIAVYAVPFVIVGLTIVALFNLINKR